MAIYESFSLGGIDFSGYNIYLGDYKTRLASEIFMPSYEVYASSVAKQTGEYYWGQRIVGNKFKLPCFAEQITELQKNQIQQLLNFATPVKLILDMRGYKYINVLLDGGINWEYIKTYNTYGDDIYTGFFEIPLYAIDPIWKSLFDSEDVLGYLEDTAYETLYYDIGMYYADDIPSATPTISATPTTFTLYNGGNYPSPCRITLTGTGTAIIVTNVTTGKTFTISSMSSETIVIDANTGQIHNNAGTLKTSKFTGDFIHIASGINNMSITGTGAISLTTIFNYKYCWL